MRLKKNCKVREVAGEKIVVLQGSEGIDLTKVIMLNQTAEVLWNQLTNIDFSTQDVAKLIVGNFQISADVAEKDAEAWIISLEKAGLLD